MRWGAAREQTITNFYYKMLEGRVPLITMMKESRTEAETYLHLKVFLQ